MVGSDEAVAEREREDGLTPGVEAPPAVSIVVPVYNERDACVGVIRKLIATMEESGLEYEVIVVDDGSTDGSAEALEQVRGAVTIASHDRNLGYGAAIKTGVRHAAHELIAITDADGTYPNDRIPDLVRGMEGQAMVVGARLGPAASIPLVRRPAKWVIGRLANYLSQTKIPDLNSGLRVMRRADILRFVRLLPNGFSFTTTITLALLTNGMPVRYERVDYDKRAGRSKIRPVRDTLNFVQLIVRTVMYFEPLRVFVPLSLLLLLASIAVLTLSVALTGHVMDVTTVVLFVAAIQMLAIGMIADIIDRRLS